MSQKQRNPKAFMSHYDEEDDGFETGPAFVRTSSPSKPRAGGGVKQESAVALQRRAAAAERWDQASAPVHPPVAGRKR